MSNTKTFGDTGRARGFRQFVAWSGEHPLLCAAAFFVITFAVRLLCSNLLGPIMIHARPDELRYLHLAKSIAGGGPLLIQGAPAEFQKILYSLLISPAFLLARDPVAQVKIVGIINVLLMSSVVFPVALLARKLTPKTSVLLLTLAFAAALPDFISTATFMCEPLYWPLCIWVFYYFHCAMAEKRPRKRVLLFALFGFFTYLAYLTKEIGAAFLIAAVAVLAQETIRNRCRLVQNGLALAVCLSAFFAPLIVVQQAVFPNLSNSYSPANGHADYDHLSLSALSSPGTFTYLLYFTAVLFMAAILSFYILPVLLPLFGFRKLDEEKRRMYLFTVFSLIITVGAMAYTIRESWGVPMPRLHLRLLAPIVIPFVILCFDLLLSKDSKKQKKKREQQSIFILMATLSLCALIVVLLPTVPTYDNWIDRASLSVSHLIWTMVSFGMDKITANLIWLAWLALMLALTIAGVICFIRGKKKTILVMLLCTIFAVSAMDNFLIYPAIGRLKAQSYSDRAVSKLEAGKYFSGVMDIFFSGVISRDVDHFANAAVSVRGYIQQLDDVMYNGIMFCMRADAWGYIETYTPQNQFIYHLMPEVIQNYMEEGNREYILDNSSDYKGLRVNYIIVMDDYNPFTNVEVVYEQAPYLVLRNLDPTRLCLGDNQG